MLDCTGRSCLLDLAASQEHMGKLGDEFLLSRGIHVFISSECTHKLRKILENVCVITEFISFILVAIY